VNFKPPPKNGRKTGDLPQPLFKGVALVLVKRQFVCKLMLFHRKRYKSNRVSNARKCTPRDLHGMHIVKVPMTEVWHEEHTPGPSGKTGRRKFAYGSLSSSMVGTVRGQYLLDDLSKDLIGLAATRSHQLRTRSERRVVHHNREPVVLSKLFHQKNLSSVLKRKAGLHSCTTLPVGLNYDVAEAKPLITAFRIGKEIFVGAASGRN